jgi:hypothetical protein
MNFRRGYLAPTVPRRSRNPLARPKLFPALLGRLRRKHERPTRIKSAHGVVRRLYSDVGAQHGGRVMATKVEKAPFDVKAFLSTVDGGRTLFRYRNEEAIFSQGDPADAVFYIQLRAGWRLRAAGGPSLNSLLRSGPAIASTWVGHGGRVRLEANSLEVWRKAGRVAEFANSTPSCYAAVLAEVIFGFQDFQFLEFWPASCTAGMAAIGGTCSLIPMRSMRVETNHATKAAATAAAATAAVLFNVES